MQTVFWKLEGKCKVCELYMKGRPGIKEWVGEKWDRQSYKKTYGGWRREGDAKEGKEFEREIWTLHKRRWFFQQFLERANRHD